MYVDQWKSLLLALVTPQSRATIYVERPGLYCSFFSLFVPHSCKTNNRRRMCLL